MKKIRSQRGETIVGVLITVAALSLILTISYALASRSTLYVRQAQERNEAHKIAQSQQERFKHYLSVPDLSNSVPDVGDVFCFKADASGDQLIEVTATPKLTGDAQGHDFSEVPNDCKTGEDLRYNNYIVRTSDATYLSYVRWARITGTGLVDEATMVYRLYPDTAAILLGAPLGATPVTTFTRNPTGDPLPFNSVVTLNWSTTNNPTSCTGTLPEFSSTAPGPHTLTIGPLPDGTYNYAIQCTKGSVTGLTKSLSFTVSPDIPTCVGGGVGGGVGAEDGC